MAGVMPGFGKMSKPFNKIASTVKGVGGAMASDARIARSMASGASSAYRQAGGGMGGLSAAGMDLRHRGAMAWKNSSSMDKARYAGYGAAGVGLTAWGLSGD